MDTTKTIGERIYPITTSVNGDEKAFWLWEDLYQTSNHKGFRRYQIIFVVRDGKLAEFHTDMGTSRKFKGVKRISIPSYFEHTVDELRFMADEGRNEKDRIDFMDLLQLDKVNLG